MEEWVGEWWHRAVTRWADEGHPEAAVTLDQVRRPIELLFRAAGGAAAVRVVPVAESARGGPRRWLQRVAGTGLRAAQSRLDPQALALPPRLAVFDSKELNRDLYLWLAAQAAAFEHTGHWLQDNHRATSRALAWFPGLRARQQGLVAAHLAQRPRPESLRPDAARAEARVQAVLQGQEPGAEALEPNQAAPVWLWVLGEGLPVAGGEGAAPDAAAQRDDAARTEHSALRRRARRAEAPDGRQAMILPSRTESLKSWSDLLRMDRATDDEADPDAMAAADDMDTLSVAQWDRRTAARVRFDLDLPSSAADDLPLGPGTRTPEWDWRRQRLQPDHCAVQCLVARPGEPYRPPAPLRASARLLRRRLEVLRAAPRWQGGQTQGDGIDLDAWVRFRTSPGADGRHSEAPPVYTRRERNDRSLATLLLADLSLSTDAYATSDARVIDVIREALYVFGEALSGTGDAFEMLGFSSVRRQHVRLQHLKGFDEGWTDAARARVGALKPGYYTRMGAAIRDATRRLSARPERQRLLLVLTDGKPNDIDVYEGRYGLEDTRHAVLAAREAGLVPFCVTIDEQAHDYLPRLFGEQGYALVHRPQDLVRRLTQAWLALVR